MDTFRKRIPTQSMVDLYWSLVDRVFPWIQSFLFVDRNNKSMEKIHVPKMKNQSIKDEICLVFSTYSNNDGRFVDEDNTTKWEVIGDFHSYSTNRKRSLRRNGRCRIRLKQTEMDHSRIQQRWLNYATPKQDDHLMVKRPHHESNPILNRSFEHSSFQLFVHLPDWNSCRSSPVLPILPQLDVRTCSSTTLIKAE